MPKLPDEPITPQHIMPGVKLRDGDTLHTQIVRASRTGMRRWMRVYLASERGQILDLTYSVGNALDLKLVRTDGWEIVLSGCTPASDAHDLIDELGRTLGLKLHRARL